MFFQNILPLILHSICLYLFGRINKLPDPLIKSDECSRNVAVCGWCDWWSLGSVLYSGPSPGLGIILGYLTWGLLQRISIKRFVINCCDRVSRMCSKQSPDVLMGPKVKSQVRQVAIDYSSVVCVPGCECKVTRKGLWVTWAKRMGPKISRVGPWLGTQWKLDKWDVEVPEWKWSRCDAVKVAGSQRAW